MKQSFSSKSNEENDPLPVYSDYRLQIGTKTIVAYEGIIENVISSSLNVLDKRELILKMKQATERALLLDLN